MKYLGWLFLILFFSSMSLFSQEKQRLHTVSKGETISQIARKYNLKPSEIYELNPSAVSGIKWKSVMSIPNKIIKNTSVSIAATESKLPEKKHEVLPKETVYGIAKQHRISIEELYKTNPNLENEGLKIGQTIKIPQTALDILATNTLPEKFNEIQNQTILVKEIPKTEAIILTKNEAQIESLIQGIEHDVVPHESLYSIAKKYGIKLSDLQKANSELGKKSLKVGQKITVPIKAGINSNLVAEKVADKKEVSTDKELSTATKLDVEIIYRSVGSETEITHEVLPKETKYGIAKKYGMTITELEKQNPNISNRLLVGSKLKILGSKLIEKETVIENSTASGADFVEGNVESTVPNTARDADFVDQLISKASENIGTRYRSGGTTTEGFDCSGLICYTFGNYDVKLPRSSNEMASYGAKIEIQNAQKGDLIFFKTNGRRQINHVGIVVEVLEGEIKFIHSSSSSGVIISSTKESYYQRNLAQINRVL